METTTAQIARLTRARDRLRFYVKGMSVSDRRAARRCIDKTLDHLHDKRRERIKRGPLDSRKETRPSFGWARAEKRDGRMPEKIPSDSARLASV